MMYHVSWWGNLRFLHTCKALGETRVKNRRCFLWRACVVYTIVRPSAGRGLRLGDVSCIWKKLALFTLLVSPGWDESYDFNMILVKNLCCLRNCKAFGGSRVKTRWCIMYLGGALCATYILVRPLVRRELRLESVSGEELVLFTYL